LDIDVRYRPCAGDGRIRLVAVEKYPVFSLEIDADGALAAQRWIPRRQTALLLGGRRLPFPTDGRWHSIRLEYGAGHESISLDGRSWRVRAEPHLTTHSYGSFLLNPGRSHADLSIRRLRVQPWFPQAQARLDAGLEQGDFRKAFAQCRSILEFAIDPEIVSWAQETMARRVLPQVIRQDLDASLADARQRRMMASHPEMAEIRVSRATEADDDLPSTPPTFYIDLREVSVEDYASFIRYVERTRDHGKCHPAEPANKDHRPRGLSPTSSQNGSLPVHGVDWFDAYAYASWAGKRLPTMAEWQRAACGDNPAAYPWGRRFDPRKVNLSGRPVPVADLPDGRSPYGCYHMSGNVEEWCADRAVKDGVDQHPVCGGSWVSSSDKAKPSAVTFRPALDREPTFGFRCAQDPE
jgi:hypothetical protein